MKKILIIDLRPLLTRQISGISVYTKNIALSLAKHFDGEIIFYQNSWKDYEFEKEFRKFKCVQTRIPNSLFNILSFFSLAPKIDSLVLNKIGLSVKTKSYFFICDPRPSPVSKFCNKIISIHDFSAYEKNNSFNFKTKLFHKLIRLKKELKEAYHVCCVSNYTRERLRKYFPNSYNKSSVCYEDIDPKIIESKSTKVKEDINGKYFISISSIESRKNLNRLCNAFINLNKKYPDIKLVIVGKTNLNIFKSCTLPEHKNIIRINREITAAEKKYLIENAIALCYVSLYEGFGLPILEAIKLKKAVIWSKNTSMLEVAGNCGYHVDPYSINSISEQMEQALLSKINEQEYFIQAKKFAWLKTCQKIIKNAMN